MTNLNWYGLSYSETIFSELIKCGEKVGDAGNALLVFFLVKTLLIRSRNALTDKQNDSWKTK